MDGCVMWFAYWINVPLKAECKKGNYEMETMIIDSAMNYYNSI